jgi:hypothetical protein
MKANISIDRGLLLPVSPPVSAAICPMQYFNIRTRQNLDTTNRSGYDRRSVLQLDQKMNGPKQCKNQDNITTPSFAIDNQG